MHNVNYHKDNKSALNLPEKHFQVQTPPHSQKPNEFKKQRLDLLPTQQANIKEASKLYTTNNKITTYTIYFIKTQTMFLTIQLTF